MGEETIPSEVVSLDADRLGGTTGMVVATMGNGGVFKACTGGATDMSG